MCKLMATMLLSPVMDTLVVGYSVTNSPWRTQEDECDNLKAPFGGAALSALISNQ